MDLTHHFLLSMPQMEDPNFRQSAIYILDHDDRGAWGLVINQGIGMALADVFEQLDITGARAELLDEAVLCGGPVDQQHGLVLHPPGPSFDSTREFSGGVALSSSRDVLEALAAGEEPRQHLVLLGHAGWAPGQLEQEIADNAWLSCEANPDILFDTALDQRRDAVARLMGIDMHNVVGQSGHA